MFVFLKIFLDTLYLFQIRRFGQTSSSLGLSFGQPRCELLDTGPVLGPELDIIGVGITLRHGALLQVDNKVSDPLQLILVPLGIRWNLI